VTIGTYLIEKDGSRTLVDTGTRNLMGPTLGKVVANLAAMGVAPDMIDRIALTHLHADHAGGMLDDEGGAVFPRAEVFLSVDEDRYWLGGEPPTDELGISAQVNSYAPKLREVYGDRWHAIGEEDVVPGLRRLALPGHTPGHSGYHLSSGTDELLIWGDITHVPVVQIANPDAAMAFDVDVDLGRATRRRILDRVATDKVGDRRDAHRVSGLRPRAAQRRGL
jgi:glyoxylase-like metal-dependent hydrolase (beta-lactamase superfamily II)